MAQRLRLAQERGAHLAQRAPDHPFVQRGGDAVEVRLVEAEPVVDHVSVRHARPRDQHHHHALAGHAHQADVAQHQAVDVRRHHEPELTGALGEELGRDVHDGVGRSLVDAVVDGSLRRRAGKRLSVFNPAN